jgi:hypothetical protein
VSKWVKSGKTVILGWTDGDCWSVRLPVVALTASCWGEPPPRWVWIRVDRFRAGSRGYRLMWIRVDRFRAGSRGYRLIRGRGSGGGGR